MEEIKKVEEVESKAMSIVDKAKTVTVTDVTTYTAAGNLWKAIKDMMKEVADTFDPLIEAAHVSHKKALEKKAKFYQPLDLASRSIKKLMSDYDSEQERIRKAEEERLQKIAQKEAEDRRLQEAIEAEKAGKNEEAAAIIETPVTVAPVVVAKATPKMEGGPVYRTIWKFRIKNAALIPREYLIVDEVKIGGLVRSMKSAVSIPGIEVYEERV